MSLPNAGWLVALVVVPLILWGIVELVSASVEYERQHPCLRSHTQQGLILMPISCGNNCTSFMPIFTTTVICDERA
jgi:hypothetical protein